MRLLKVLFICLLILFPFGEVLRFDIGNNISLKPSDVVAVLLCLTTAYVYLRNKLFQKSLKWYYFFFPIVSLISLFVNSYWLQTNEFLTSFLYWLRWISYMSIFFAVLIFDTSFRKKIIKFLIIDGLLVLLAGYIQFFFYPSLRDLFYLGWDEHLYRMFSTFLDPNFVGAFFVLYLIFIATMLFHNVQKWERWRIISSILILALALVAIFLTYSRSALLMLVLSGITLFILLNKKKYILYLLGTIVAFIIIISPFFYLENINLFRINSSLARVNDLGHVSQIIINNLLLGVGFNSYRYAQVRYHLISSYSPFPSHSDSGDDTSLLFVFATTGIAGLIAYCNLWWEYLKKAIVHYKNNAFALIFIASFAGLFIDSVFNNSLFYAEIMLWMWIITGFMFENKT